MSAAARERGYRATPREASAFLHVVPTDAFAHEANDWGSIHPRDYFGFPRQFDASEVQRILHTEVRTHDSDGTPLSVYFGPTRVGMLADMAIEFYGEEHAEAVRAMAEVIIEDYVAKF